MSLEQTIGNLDIRYANTITFVGSSNTMVDTTTGRIQTKGFQHNSNVITDISGPHGRVAPTLKKYPEIIFEEGKVDRNDSTNTYVQAGYTVSASSQYIGNGTIYRVWKQFDGILGGTVAGQTWIPGNLSSYNSSGDYVLSPANNLGTGADNGEWVKLELPNKITLERIHITHRDGARAPEDFKVYGSIDNVNWVEILSETGASPALISGTSYTADVKTTAYKYLGMVIKKIVGSGYFAMDTLELYGYEEYTPAGDHSVDTTFMSRFNNPQLTGVQVLVDGATGLGTNQISGGVDPSGNNDTYDATNKYWTLNGTLTSNITVEANTFLEGDQPHSVSVWFNSSNLEANVSNTCVFSISDQEKLDSVNLDLQSNTWHNLTYAYQGEGGSRVTYLDGRKVAEDQAEDTFGEYPPFAMTGYSQGGYVVSASSESGANRAIWKAFNKVTTDDWWEDAPYPSYTNGVYNGAGSYSLGGISGQYVIIELPYKIGLNYIAIAPRTNLGGRSPGTGVILGSNDKVNWEQIHSFSGLTYTNDVFTTININTTKKYSVFAIVVTNIAGSEVNTGLQLGEIKYYGHRENDLVRLPDPTNVLKYPHIAMTGPAQRGYVVQTSGNNATSNDGWKAFNGVGFNGQTNAGDHWITPNLYTYNTGVFGQGTTAIYQPLGNGATGAGAWIAIKSPHKIKLTKLRVDNVSKAGFRDYTVHGRNGGGAIVGGTSWSSALLTVVDEGSGYSQSGNYVFTETSHNITTNDYYDEFIIIITKKTPAAGTGDIFLIMRELEFYGTEENSSIPIQIGGGNIDKVANFRVYDKFIGEDQALEIWDAQKDHFGRAKSQMVLQQGKLGVGTDAPQGRFSVADEPHNLEEFPPRAMTGYKNYFEGHGEFRVRASTEQNTTTTLVWHIFTKISDNNLNKRWRSSNSRYDNTVNPATTTSAAATFDGIGVRGEWILLEMPYNICLKRYEFVGFLSQTPHTGQIWGSDDNGTTWHHIDTFENAVGVTSYPSPTNTFHVLGNTRYYSRYVFIIEKLTTADDAVSMSSLKFFGTREQGQSVLHDGQLTLTKNLNVPRIGPALDADDTPRRDRLVVEYNTSTNPTFEGAVRDTSGRGNDGVFYNGASYSATEKALVFDGTTSDQYVHTLKNGTSESGNINYSVSLWFNPTTVNVARWRAVFAIGVLDRTQPTDNNGDEITLFVNNGTNALHLQNGGSSVNTGALNAGQWVHIVVTYDGTNRKIYLDGSLSISNGYTTLNLPNEMLIRLAQSIPNGNAEQDEYMDCKISNFKAWFGASLTAEEVKTLYDMGRCDEGHHVVNFSKTRVGIGLGDGEAPRAALDVRGDVAGPFHTFLTGDITTTSSSPTSSAYSPLVSYTFDVPKEYNSYGNANLEVFGQVKWSGECPDPWNTNFSLRLYYGSGLTSYIGSAQVSGGSNSKGCGMIAVSHHADNNSTLDSAIASSKFLIPNCPVSLGSQLKLEILHSQGAGSGTVYTNRTTDATTTDYNYERGTTNFFMALKVV
jgi:hypothetical protein